MDFETAISAHGEWRVKLILFINDSGRLDEELVEDDHKCSLGCWLYGEGKRFSAYEEYQDFKSDHAEFHRLAAEVVRMVKEGRKQDAKECLAVGGPFSKLNMKIDERIIRLRCRVQAVA